MDSRVMDAFAEAVAGAEEEIAPAALAIARLEYPRLESSHYLAQLDLLGAGARARLDVVADRPPRARLATLSRFLSKEEGFAGNRRDYEDPRNSYLNEVLDRRTGIPVTLALVYLEVGRRAGIRMEGVNFPGHFLLRYPANTTASGEELILDPFNGGSLLDEEQCRALLRQQSADEIPFTRELLARANKRQMLFRILGNLKRIYVRFRSFPQARDTTTLMLALEPGAVLELRDRGLLSYHLDDFPAALRDLEAYLQLARREETEESREDLRQIWEHVKALRRRIASFN